MSYEVSLTDLRRTADVFPDSVVADVRGAIVEALAVFVAFGQVSCKVAMLSDSTARWNAVCGAQSLSLPAAEHQAIEEAHRIMSL